jgi:hypothetical protein
LAAKVIEAPQVAAKAEETPQVTPMQDGSSPEARDVWERGLLMFEHAQRIINQLQNYIDILNMDRIPEDNSNRSHMGPRGPEFIDLDQIIGLDDLQFTMPLIGLLTDVSDQLGTAEASQRTGASNSISEMIKIYDDDESPKVSLVTLVHIEEEKGLEKTYFPILDAQIKEVP